MKILGLGNAIVDVICKVDDELQVTLNGSSHEGEGFVKFNEYGHIKLVRRGSFSYANFNNRQFR